MNTLYEHPCNAVVSKGFHLNQTMRRQCNSSRDVLKRLHYRPRASSCTRQGRCCQAEAKARTLATKTILPLRRKRVSNFIVAEGYVHLL